MKLMPNDPSAVCFNKGRVSYMGGGFFVVCVAAFHTPVNCFRPPSRSGSSKYDDLVSPPQEIDSKPPFSYPTGQTAVTPTTAA